jgi:dephospho-CoA kinase
MKPPFKLGLTGSIGMGKSTTAGFFMAQNIPVWDADTAVHRLYSAEGAAVAPLAESFPLALIDNAISRTALKTIIAADPAALGRIESIVHPLVAADRASFLLERQGTLVVLDIPLLFETGADAEMDATLLVTAPPDIQRARVMARPGMTELQFATILARQMPDAEKRRRAGHIVETLSLGTAAAYVSDLIRYLQARHA